VSSVVYAAIPAFAVSTAYTVGQFVKPITPVATNRHAFRCTTAGTTAASEPSWAYTNNATTASGTAVFTTVSGQPTYAWTAPAGDIGSVTGDGSGAARVVLGDRIFVSSDHSESATSKSYFTQVGGTWSGNYLAVLSVNRAGSVPPVPADILFGAALITTSATLLFDCAAGPVFMQGLSLQAATSIYFNSSFLRHIYFKDCVLWLNNATGSSRIYNNNPARVVWDNTAARFGHVGQGIGGIVSYSLEITWLNTGAPLLGTVPTALFAATASSNLLMTCRGVDFSALTTALVTYGSGGTKLLLDSCKIAPAVGRYVGAPAGASDLVELVNCFDGTNIVNERYAIGGSIVTERTIVMSGGAQDDVGVFSHKMVSTALLDRWSLPLEGFWLDIENQAVGSSKTATVEIVSSASLNNDEISLLLEYQGTTGSSVATITTTLPATVLTAPSAVASSSATWASSPGVAQRLQVTFTPRVAGRVRGQVRLGKPSTTVYYNPVIAIT